ncbi:flagella-associated protein CFAP57 [Acrasis kona]|uniref:Flagella-associated protein CFAP57 n=1 Tax=Acrasis kona TaxID=1008807 RepID=A0AAW2YSM3_9EUKA
MDKVPQVVSGFQEGHHAHLRHDSITQRDAIRDGPSIPNHGDRQFETGLRRSVQWNSDDGKMAIGGTSAIHQSESGREDDSRVRSKVTNSTTTPHLHGQQHLQELPGQRVREDSAVKGDSPKNLQDVPREEHFNQEGIIRTNAQEREIRQSVENVRRRVRKNSTRVSKTAMEYPIKGFKP